MANLLQVGEVLRVLLIDYQELKKVLNQSLEKILLNSTPKDTGGTVLSHRKSSNEKSRLLNTSLSDQDVIEIDLHLNGYLIPFASFNMKFARGNQITSFLTQVRNPKYPLVSQQLLELHALAESMQKKLADDNFLDQVRSQVDPIDLELLLSGAPNDEQVKTMFKGYSGPQLGPICELLDGLVKDCTAALHLLTQAFLHDFPYILHTQSKCFQPPLSQELIIQTFIKQDKMYCASYLVHKDSEAEIKYDKKTRKKIAQAQHALNYSFLAGTEEDMNLCGKFYEFDSVSLRVVDQLTVCFEVGFLADNWSLWKKMYKKTKHLKQKLLALKQVDDMMYKPIHTPASDVPEARENLKPLSTFLF